MSSLLCNIFLILITSLCQINNQEHSVNDESLCLPEIDLSNYPHMKLLISRIVKEVKGVTNNGVQYLTIDLKNDTCGIRMEIVAHTRKRIFWYDKYSGYALIEGKPVIFENQSNIELKVIPNSNEIFPMASRFDPPILYDPDEWLFILQENRYARYYEGRGWIWFKYDNLKVP